MKKKIIILSVISFFIVLCSFSMTINISLYEVNHNDTIPYNKNLSSYGYVVNRLLVDSVFVVPNIDTVFGTDVPRVGSLVYRTVGGDSTLYVRYPTRWVKVGTSGGLQTLTKNISGDSIILSGGGEVSDNDKQQLMLSNDTLYLTNSIPAVLNFLLNSSFIDSLNNHRQLLTFNTTDDSLTISNGNSVYVPAAPVLSVNGKTGNVNLTTDSVPEGYNNLYFTPTRVRSAIFGSNGIGFNTATGTISPRISSSYGNSLSINPDGLYVTVPSDSEIINKVNIADSNKVFTTPTYIRNQGFITQETDPLANAKTVTLNSGTGISVQGNTTQTVGSNPSFTINSQNTSPLWNANQLQGYPLSNAIPVNGQVLQLNGGVWVPTTQSDTSAKFTVTFASNFGNTFQNNPVTGTGTIYVNTDSTKVGTLYALNDTAKSISSRLNNKLDINDTTGNWAPRGSYVHTSDTVGKWAPAGNYKMGYDSTESTGYVSNTALNDSLNKINGINGWLYNPASKTGQVDSTKYSTVRATHDSVVANIPNLSIYTKYTDTSSMLSPYTKKGSNVSQFANDARYIDSAGMKNLGNSNLTINEFRDLNLNGYGLTIDDSLTSYNPPRLFISATQSSLGAYAFNNQGTSLDLLNTGGRLYHVNPSSNNTAYQFSVSDTGWSFETNYMHILDINDSGILRFSQPRYEAATGDSSALGINDQGQLIKLPVLPSLQGQNISTFNNDVGYYKPSDTTSTLGTKYYINSQGFLKSYTETDPVWNAAKNGNTTIPGTWSFPNGFNTSSRSIYGVSSFEFSNGFFIQTTMDSSSSNSMSVLHIIGNGYNSVEVVNATLQFYNLPGTGFIEKDYRGTGKLTKATLLYYNGKVCIWLPYDWFGETLDFTLYNYVGSRISSVTNSSIPSSDTSSVTNVTFTELASQPWVTSQNYLKQTDLHDSLTQNALDVLFPLTLDATNKTLSVDTTMKDSSLVNYRQMKQYMSTNTPPTYVLPTASTTTLGGVKVDGTTVTINGSGVISVVAGGSGTVTSVGLAGSNGINVSGSPVTTSGTISVSNDTANVIAAKKWVRDSMMAKGTSVVNNVYGVTPISVTGNTNQPFIHINQATTSTDGYLSSIDWNTFNGKKSNSDSTALIGYVSHNAMNDTLAGKIIMNTPVDSVSLNGNNLSTTDQSITGDRDIDLNGHTLQINDKTQSYPGSGGLFSNSWVQLSLADGGGHSNATVSLNNPLSPNVQITAQGYNSGSIPTIYTQDSSGFKWSINNTSTNIAQLYTNGSLQLTNSLVAASASITNNISSGGIITAKNLSATGQLSIADTVVTSSFTIGSTHSLYICNSSTGITATLSTADVNWNGSPLVIIKNIGTGTVTLTNTWTSDPTTIAAGASEMLAMVDISGTTYWIKLN